MLARVEGVTTLLEKVIEHQTQAELGEWVTTCRAEDCDDRPQQKQGRILFATKGTMEVSFPEASNPASSSWAAPTSRRNHDEVDERTERVRLTLVCTRCTRWGRPHEERKHAHSSGTRTSSQNAEPSILVLLEGRTPGHLDVCDDGSTCRAAPRPKWDSGGSLQRPRLVEQPAPRERTQIPVATQFL